MTTEPSIENSEKEAPGKDGPESERLEILYQDEQIVAIHKPAGLLVHKSPIDRHEKRYAMKLLRNQLGQWVYPVHRLDKPTSGVLIFTLDELSARALSEQFENRRVSKRYLALVRGYAPTSGHIDHALGEIAAFKDQQAKADLKEAQSAQTDFKRLNCYELPFPDGRFPTSRYSLVQLHPLTGRKHQLRRHLKHISHPIIGDVKYGKGPHNRLFREQYDCQRLMLASTQITFHHPASGETLTINASPESSFSHTMAQLEKFRVMSDQI